MFAAARLAVAARTSARAFSTTLSRSADVSKLILVGHLGKDAEVRTTKNDKEYVVYTVATTDYPAPAPNPDGSRKESTTTWHTVFSFNPSPNIFLRNLQKGSLVYVEANFQLRQPDPTADQDSPQGQRQIFLRHETIRVLSTPNKPSSEGEE